MGGIPVGQYSWGGGTTQPTVLVVVCMKWSGREQFDDQSQGIFMKLGHRGNRDRKRGMGVAALVQTTKSPQSVAIFAHPSLAFDLVTRSDLAR